jgi:electron transfer flavoprotein alpha subunit
MVMLFAEHHRGRLDSASREAAAAGRVLLDRLPPPRRPPLVAVALGPYAAVLRSELAQHGVDRILICEEDRLDGRFPEVRVEVLAELAQREGGAASLLGDTPEGADLAVRLSARCACRAQPPIGAPLARNCIALEWQGSRIAATCLGYSGRLQRAVLGPRVVLLRPGAFEAKRAPRAGKLERFVTDSLPTAPGVEVLETIKADPRTVPLGEAEFIISGGNGVRDFGPLWELADRLGASVGGSRVVCDDGRLPRERQVGESGATVRPRCYLAFGISGAIQHLRGMQESELIIAVNTDPFAPLMKLANLAAVGDAQATIEALQKRLSARPEVESQ